MIRTRFELTHPDDAEATLTLTMTLGEWNNLRATLEKAGAYPGWRVARVISDMIVSAREHFVASTEGQQP